MMEKDFYTFEDLVEIVAALRRGCPWDQVQTHESMKKYLVEECSEVLEAIDAGDMDNLCEELGDVLYQIMMHSEMEKEKGNFTAADVVDGICKKWCAAIPMCSGIRKRGLLTEPEKAGRSSKASNAGCGKKSVKTAKNLDKRNVSRYKCKYNAGSIRSTWLSDLINDLGGNINEQDRTNRSSGRKSRTLQERCRKSS